MADGPTTFDIVSGAFATLTAYISANNANAVAAMNALAALELPIPGTKDITYEPFDIVEAEDADPPDPVGSSLGLAPPINPIVPPVSPVKLTIVDPELGELLTIVIPDPPEVEWPVSQMDTIALGNILGIIIPDPPPIDWPELDLDPPTYDVSPPLPWAFAVGDILISDDPMIRAAITRLTNNIAYGGTGLTPAIEEAIWDREQERSEQQLSDSTDKVTSMWAKKGFSLPDGFLANSLSDLQKEYMNKRLDTSRDIAIKQAELEQSNLFKSLELSVKLASELINMLIRYEELVFRGQEATAKFANEYIDLQIKAYNSRVEAYKTTVQIYESIIRANMVKVEIFKAQIEGQIAIGNVNEQTVKIYQSEITAEIARYNGLLEANVTKGGIFKTQIEGQIAIGQVNEQTIKVFSDLIRANIAYIEKYKAEVDAMTAELGVEKVKVEVNKLQMDAWATNANVLIAVYNGAVEMYKSKAQQNISVADVESKQIEAAARAHLQATELAVKTFEVEERSIQAIAALQVEAAKSVATSAASLAAGALAALNANASLGFQSSYQDSHYTDETPI